MTLHVGTVDSERFIRWKQYMAEGWEIDPPIFVRPVWHTLERQRDVYHFILKREGALHLMVIPFSADVEHFVQEREYPLNRL